MNIPGKFMNISGIISNFCNESLSQNHMLNAKNWQISQFLNGEHIYTKSHYTKASNPYRSIILSLAAFSLRLSKSRSRVAASISSSRPETLAHATSRAACYRQQEKSQLKNTTQLSCKIKFQIGRIEIHNNPLNYQ